MENEEGAKNLQLSRTLHSRDLMVRDVKNEEEAEVRFMQTNVRLPYLHRRGKEKAVVSLLRICHSTLNGST